MAAAQSLYTLVSGTKVKSDWAAAEVKFSKAEVVVKDGRIVD